MECINNHKKIKNKIKAVAKHPVFSFIVAVQVIFILALSFKTCVTPKIQVSLSAGALFNTDGKIAFIEDDTLKLDADKSLSEGEDLSISSVQVNLPSGGYNVNITYDSTVGDGKITESNANVSLSSRSGISFDTVILNDQDNVASGRLWIPIFTNCDDLTVKISYNGVGTLTISNITFEEASQYRLMQIVGFVLLFAMVDVFILIFFSDIKLKINRTHGILLLIIFISSVPFIAKNLFYGHDLWFHTIRIVSVAEELNNRQFPVRMSTELNNGFGYPTSIYYCDIFLYPVALLYLMFVPLRTCYQIYVIIVNVATTIFAYISFGKITKKEHLKLIGTGLYVLSIYRLMNVNIRAAVGEYTAMAFLPLVIAGIYMIYTTEKPSYKEWGYLTFGMAGIIMSHVLTVEMVAINLMLLCMILIKKTLKKDVLFSLLKAALLCTGITFWLVVPFGDFLINQDTFAEKSSHSTIQSSTRSLIYILQMFSSGTEADYYATVGMPLIVGLGIILYYLVRYKEFKKTQPGNVLRLMSILIIINTFLACEYFPWDRIQKFLADSGFGIQIGNVQFSWRFLGIASAILAFAIVLTLGSLEDKKARYIRAAEMGILTCLVISVGLFYYKYADEASRESYNMVQSNSSTDNLYLLYGADLNHDKSIVQTMSGDVELTGRSKSEGVYTVHVDNSDTEAVITVPIYGYRYYNAYDDAGSLLETEVTSEKYLAVKIPANYTGNISVKFVPPVYWRVAEIISLLCVVFTVVKIVRDRLCVARAHPVEA